jgi:metallophosphoesterase superfamily enzyme
MNGYRFSLGGQALIALASGALHWPAQGLLCVSDLHLGKAESFQSQGIPLPSDGDGATLNALLALAHSHSPAQVLVLAVWVDLRLGRKTV